MDAGTAAVLGALAGSIATIGAALATGWAQREGARITARSEHRRERREPRHDIYKEFISEANQLSHQTGLYLSFDVDLMPDDITEDRRQLLSGVSAALDEKALEAALAGPKRVTEAALETARLSHRLVGSALNFQGLTEERHQRMRDSVRKSLLAICRRYERSLEGFVFQAQSALDDDGSRK
ncbi:hypothetical protein WKI65_04460 [Streptomyces sp. MS1.AVA.3]|uniref:hypothetical protein n=1 Tax=Streptomyces decoyicus TaxID=249567 RepID=UPI0030C40E4F